MCVHVCSGGGRHFCIGGLAQPVRMAAKFCRVLRICSRGTLDNVQHALGTSLRARGRDTIPV